MLVQDLPSRCLGYFSYNSNKHTTVLRWQHQAIPAALLLMVLGVEGVDVIILYPSKVSDVQELQLTTLGKIFQRLK